MVYELAFPNGKVYVGITTVFKRRMREHAKGGRGMDGHLVSRGIRKWGWANVKVSILERDVPKELLREREVHWVRERRSMSKEWGYNLTPGGDAQPMEDPRVQQWQQRRIKEAMNRDDVREKKRALWQSDEHKEMMREARLNFESAEKRRHGFAQKREEEISGMGVLEGKALMLKTRDRIVKNAKIRKSVTEGQTADALAFWEKEWARYEELYWSAPPQASSCAQASEDRSWMIPSDSE